MKKYLSLILLFLSFAAHAGKIDSPTFTGALDASGVTSSKPVKTGTVASLPATCVSGMIYFATNATAGQNLYYCTATNTWTQQTSGGASPLTTEGDLYYYHTAANARLAVGSNGQCLTSNGTDPVWGSCGAGGSVTTTGTPASGNLAKFSGSTTLTNGDLTGDATTSGTLAVTVTKINGTSLAGLATGILKNTTATGVPSIAIAADFPTLNQSTTGSAATLTTPRAIYGNNFDGSTALTQIIASTYGGTGNGFTKFSGPATTEKTFTLPNASDTLMGLATTDAITGTKTFGDGTLNLAGSTSGSATLKAPAVASTYVATLPAATDTLVGKATTDTLSNKTLTAPVINAYTECTDAPTITAGAVTIDNSGCTWHKLSLVANTTITLPAASAGISYTVQVCYGGAYTVTWAGGTTLSWPADTAPTATSVSGKCDFYIFGARSTITYGFDGGRNYTGS